MPQTVNQPSLTNDAVVDTSSLCLRLAGAKVVVLTAHPDDESLFFGGLIAGLEAPAVWCCSIPRREPIRAMKFFDAVEVLEAFPRIVPWVEAEPTEHLPYLDTVDLKKYEVIVTHNHIGEYSHNHHKDVHAYALEAANNDAEIWVSAYGLGLELPQLDSPHSIMKRMAIMQYNHYSALLGCVKYEELFARWSEKFPPEQEGYIRWR